MAFCDHMAKFINPSGFPDSEFYIKGTAAALTAWLGEIRQRAMSCGLLVDGTVTTLTTPPTVIKVTGAKTGKLVGRSVTVTDAEVKAAMWCGDPSQSFSRLFSLAGKRLAASITAATAAPLSAGEKAMAATQPFVTGAGTAVTLSVSHFSALGEALRLEARGLGRGLDAETFLELESDFLDAAVQQIPPQTLPLTGLCMGGVFTGTIGVDFAWL